MKIEEYPCKLKEIYNDNVGYNEKEEDYYGYNFSQQLSFENIKMEQIMLLWNVMLTDVIRVTLKKITRLTVVAL